ncbi:poly(A)-binding protein, putative [Plasmodium malariae]|uniref:Poly(A)-binding protein, putative n=1 Tax=Plasmodium malariae TaxID=5858 RepID=A0A1C3KZ64_PLAMA|nr:poly(A)-binding protein, putative [Plasmodium malariae]
MEWNKSFQSNSIFVYNFPNEWMENDIKKNFLMFGTINNIIIDKDINVYAFIQYNDSESSQKAIEKFKTFGNLESATVAKKNDKSSKGYGFVVYTDPHSAALAISNMNKVEVYTGKRLKVLLKSNSNENNKKKIKPGCTIFVFYLPNDWSDKDLKRHFSHYGNILGATIKRETNGKSRGYGFINFENQQSAINAVAGMNGFNAGNKYLKVSIKKGEEQYLAPQYVNIDRMPNNSYTSPPPPPPPISCHGNDSSNFANNEMYSIQNTLPNNRFNSRVSTNEMHQSFINSQYGHFPYNFFKNNEQGAYMQRSYNKNYNMGKT